MACFHALPLPSSSGLHSHAYWIAACCSWITCATHLLTSERIYKFVSTACPCCSTCRPQMDSIAQINGYSEPGAWHNLRNCTGKVLLDFPPLLQFSINSVFAIFPEHIFNSSLKVTQPNTWWQNYHITVLPVSPNNAFLRSTGVKIHLSESRNYTSLYYPWPHFKSVNASAPLSQTMPPFTAQVSHKHLWHCYLTP